MTSERDLINQMAYREKKGIEIGKEQGKAEGIEKGKEQGIEETKLATAKKMLEKNYTIDEISDITGLPLETLKGLK